MGCEGIRIGFATSKGDPRSDYFYRSVNMPYLLNTLAALALVCACSAAYGQRVDSPSHLTDDLCGCMGSIDLSSDDRTFDLAVKHCLNKAVVEHPGEVLSLLHRYPDERQKAYLLGLLIGGTLDRTCSQYPAVKERLRSLSAPLPPSRPST
jgi:hypothetical protein